MSDQTTAAPAEPVITNPIFAMAAKASALRASGVDVITLAAGEPETSTADQVVAAAVAAAHDPAAHHYGAAAGLPELRELIAARTGALHRIPVDANDVQVTIGAKHALHMAFRAVSGPGDEVLVLRPGWPGHAESVDSVGATAVHVDADADFTVSVAALEAARTERTKALVLANPANPTGAVHRSDHVRDLLKWCVDHDIWFVYDEVYDTFVYDGIPHSPALTLVPETRSRIVLVNAVSKTHAMTGWRVGWLVGPPEVLGPTRKYLAQTITNVPVLTQAAAVAALRDTMTPQLAVQQYRKGRDLLVDALTTIPGVDCVRPDGGMFAFPQVTDLLRSGRWASNDDLALWLLENAHVAVVSGSAFGSAEHLRINFAIDHDRLGEAARRLVAALH